MAVSLRISSARAAPSAGRTLVRSLGLSLACIVPALAVRLAGVHPNPVVAMVVYGAAVVAASFLLAWAAEAAQIDVSGGLAIAVLALVAVLPEYAVDLYYAFTAGHLPQYTQYATANMTGSNRLLMGLGWPLVVLVGIVAARKVVGRNATTLALAPNNRVELGFLLVAGVVAFIAPLAGGIHIVLAAALLAWFGFYLYKLTRGDVEEPELVGTAAVIGELSDRSRKTAVVALFAAAAAVILLCAPPFAESLIHTSTQLGIDRFLLVQWLAPLASEAPELIVAIIFAARGKGTVAIAMLISAKVNQWTLLIGSLPVAFILGGGGVALHLDGRQTEELLLTATQTVMGVALILALRFPPNAAWALLALFVVQFPLTSTHGRLTLCAVYTTIAAIALIVNRRHLLPTLRAPFVGQAERHGGQPHQHARLEALEAGVPEALHG